MSQSKERKGLEVRQAGGKETIALFLSSEGSEMGALKSMGQKGEMKFHRMKRVC